MLTRRSLLKKSLIGAAAAAAGAVARPIRIFEVKADPALAMVQGDNLEVSAIQLVDRAGKVVHSAPTSVLIRMKPGDNLTVTHKVELYNDTSLAFYPWQRELLEKQMRSG